MAALPARLRALVVLSDLFELGVGELAEVAGGGVGRLERQVAEAEERLRASLDDPGELGAIEEIGDDA
jgi:DNA-directed RNA polymerase specialized sigma24 family protein